MKFVGRDDNSGRSMYSFRATTFRTIANDTKGTLRLGSAKQQRPSARYSFDASRGPAPGRNASDGPTAPSCPRLILRKYSHLLFASVPLQDTKGDDSVYSVKVESRGSNFWNYLHCFGAAPLLPSWTLRSI